MPDILNKAMAEAVRKAEANRKAPSPPKPKKTLRVVGGGEALAKVVDLAACNDSDPRPRYLLRSPLTTRGCTLLTPTYTPPSA